jgi:hypothetical protein
MNRATKINELPALTIDFLSTKGVLIDNVFASLWRETGMKTLLSRAGFNKRSGTPMYEVIYGLMLWIDALDMAEKRLHWPVCSARLAGRYGQGCIL